MIDPQHWRVWLPPVIVLASAMLAPTIAVTNNLKPASIRSWVTGSGLAVVLGLVDARGDPSRLCFRAPASRLAQKLFELAFAG